MSDWGKGVNNDIGWGQGGTNDIGYGSIYAVSNSGLTLLLKDAFDPAYQAVLDFATSEGITLPSTSQQELQNQVVLSLKDKGLWNKKDAFGLFATDGNVDFALICWKRLIKMDAISSPTFTLNAGFDGNGSSSYIDTLFRPAIDGVNFLQDDAGVSVNTNFDDGGYILGTSSIADGNIRIRQKRDPDSQINSSYFFAEGVDFSVTGNIHVDRISSTEVTSRSSDGSVTTANNSTGLTLNPIWLLRIVDSYTNSNILSFSARSSFTEQEKDDYDTIINTYLNAL
jgi:hypothetical protein